MIKYIKIITTTTILASMILLHPLITIADVVSPKFSQSTIDRAMSLPILTDNAGRFDIWAAAHYLSIVAYFNSNAASSDGRSIADRTVENLTSVVSPGNEPGLRGIMFSWGDHHVAGLIAFAKYNPAVWEKLSPETKERADLLMRVGTFIANIQHNAANQCYLDIKMTDAGNYNPNQRNSMVAWMSYAYIYFGSAEKVNSVLSSFDHPALIKKLSDFGWSKLTASLSGSDTVKLMIQGGQSTASKCEVNPEGVRKAFTFKGRIVTGDPGCPAWYETGSEVAYDPYNLLRREEYDFNLAAQIVDKACKIDTKCGTAGHIADGFASPNLGEIGMFLEYNINGRSSPDYVAWGAKNSLFHLTSIIAAGLWKSGSTEYDEIIARYKNAVKTWLYRVEGNKWYDTAFCEFKPGPDLYSGRDFAIDLWNAMIDSDIVWSYKPIMGSMNTLKIVPPKIINVDMKN